MNLSQILNIHFKNALFMCKPCSEQIEMLQLELDNLIKEDVIDLNIENYLANLTPQEFFMDLSIDLLNNIPRRNTEIPLSKLSDRQIQKIPYTSSYIKLSYATLGIIAS